MKRMLVQTQLSNIRPDGKFVLECDSGWLMATGRAREFLKLNPDLHIDIMGPVIDDMDGPNSHFIQTVARPESVSPDVFATGRLQYRQHWIKSNALATRYDFDFDGIAWALELEKHKNDPTLRYDIVYMNDPCHVKNFRAMFHLVAGYQPKIATHSHFIDNPSCPKFPVSASLWHGQVEGAMKSDFNFWQCESAMDVFFQEMSKQYSFQLVNQVRANSMPADDGYSSFEMNTPIVTSALRFTEREWTEKTAGKTVIFFPNRISPGSGDYTNGMKFMFELLPQLRRERQDFVVVCGNPNFKFSNDELVQRCGKDGYIKLLDDTPTRNEYRFIASHSDIVVGLYDKDAYGSTASRECIEMGCLPLWCDLFEYKLIGDQINYPFRCRPDFAGFTSVASMLIDYCKSDLQKQLFNWHGKMKGLIRERCSYEVTTSVMMKHLGL